MHDGPDRGKRYRSSLSRARALYRIPTVLTGGRTLEILHRRSPLMAAAGFETQTVSFNVGVHPLSGSPEDSGTDLDRPHVDYSAPLPFDEISFDRVLVHRTLDDLAEASRERNISFNVQGFLGQIARVLVPGGMIAGCIDNRIGLKSSVRRVKRQFNSFADPATSGHFSPSGLRNALEAADFVDIHLFVLLPNCDEPLRLVDTDPRISKALFRHELLAARQLWSPFGYCVRRVAVELGIYSKFEESIFFWAHKRC